MIEMGMPQIPDGKNRPNFEETIIDLLESVALEEMALAHMMNAEGEKMQELVRQFRCMDICFCEMEDASKNMQHMVSSMIMKEWLLMSKLHTIIEVKETMQGPSERQGHCKEHKKEICEPPKEQETCGCYSPKNYRDCEPKKEKLNYYCRQE
ncbi:MAG: hypothetical protein ACRCTE_10595 [Cellulosilyticaceae bacterium]